MILCAKRSRLPRWLTDASMTCCKKDHSFTGEGGRSYQCHPNMSTACGRARFEKFFRIAHAMMISSQELTDGVSALAAIHRVAPS